jgi:hypothetical protein
LRFSAVSQLPERLRVELFTSGFPKLVTLLLVDGPEVIIFDARERKLFGAQDSRAAIQGVLGVPLSAEDLMFWGIGRLPENESLELQVSRDFSKTKRFVLSQVFEDGSWSSLGSLQPCDSSEPIPHAAREEESLFVRDGDVLFSAQLRYAEGECFSTPEAIDFSLREHGVRGELSNIITEFEPDLSGQEDRLFSLEQFIGETVMPLNEYQSQYDQNRNSNSSSNP